MKHLQVFQIKHLLTKLTGLYELLNIKIKITKVKELHIKEFKIDLNFHVVNFTTLSVVKNNVIFLYYKKSNFS